MWAQRNQVSGTSGQKPELKNKRSATVFTQKLGRLLFTQTSKITGQDNRLTGLKITKTSCRLPITMKIEGPVCPSRARPLWWVTVS